MIPSLKDLLKRHLLEQHHAAITAALIPAVRIATAPTGRELAPGVSKFGGEPGLHTSDRWPAQDGRPLHFVGQIRLSDAFVHLPRGPLPARGCLRLWYNTIAERERQERSEIDGTVFEPSLLRLTFEPDESRPVSRRPFPKNDEAIEPAFGYPWKPLPECALEFSPMTCIRDRAYDAMYEAEWAIDRKGAGDRCDALRAAIEGPYRRGDHRLLGDVAAPQSDPQFAAACMAAGVVEFASHSKPHEKKRRDEAARYRLLLSLDSDRNPDFDWGDDGSLQWWIRDDHLAAGDLERAVGLANQGG